VTDLDLRIDSSPASGDIEALGRGLTEHALPTTGVPGFQPLAVWGRDAQGTLRAGIFGHANWNWLHIALFWIAEDLRHGGLGSRMIGMIEAAALERGCRNAHLDTFSYQARPFYERHGYELFATLEDYPPGQARYFLRKRLVED
jgi:GNAT superfamily N-acetyltransferase